MAKSFCLQSAMVAIMCLSTMGALPQTAAGWKAGLARVKITPPRPVVLLGYGDRTAPFEAVVADIYAKALALEDRRGQRAVIVTADLVGFQAAVVTDEVCRRLGEKTGLQRKQLLFNASHSHTGPLVSLDPHAAANAVAHAPLTADDVRETVAYTRALQDQLVQLVCDALARLAPARLSWGSGRVDFPMNRRLPQGRRIVMSDNPAGPTDRSVPVLRIDASASARMRRLCCTSVSPPNSASGTAPRAMVRRRFGSCRKSLRRWLLLRRLLRCQMLLP